VTFSSAADPIFTGVCHCATCQKETGSAYAAVLAVPTDSLSLSGALTQFDSISDSGNAVHRAFCPTCGSIVTRQADVMAGITMLSVGTLDGAVGIKPSMQIFCDSAMPWAVLGGEVKSFPKMPG
jgi:hypothetical protein